MTSRGAPRPVARFRLVAATALLVAAAALASTTGEAQLVDPRRPTRLEIGAPRGPAPTPRVDPQRRARAKDALPTGPLEASFRRALGATTDHAALTGDDGRSVVVTGRGDVVFLDHVGEEVAHANASSSVVSPPTLTSDGTVVFATSAGDAVGVTRAGHVRFASRVLEGRTRDVAPLALDDGGAVLATGAELVVIDAEGSVRSRSTLPEPPAGPLLVWRDQILAVAIMGVVYALPPGGVPRRVGSFGGPLDGGATLVDGDTLTGVYAGEVVDVDLVKGTRTSRGAAPEGFFLGPVASYAPGGPRSVALMHLAANGVPSVVALDAAGAELAHAVLPGGVGAALSGPDGGGPLVMPPHVGVVSDPAGAVAFATPEGVVGVVGPKGDVGTLAAPPCSKVGRSGGVVGLTPAGRGAFLVTCQSGVVARVESALGAPGKSP